MKTMLPFILVSLMVQCPLYGMQAQDNQQAQDALLTSNYRVFMQEIGNLNQQHLEAMLPVAKAIEIARPSKKNLAFRSSSLIIAGGLMVAAGWFQASQSTSSDTLDVSCINTCATSGINSAACIDCKMTNTINVPQLLLGVGICGTGAGPAIYGVIHLNQWNMKRDAGRIVASIEQRLALPAPANQGQAVADDVV